MFSSRSASGFHRAPVCKVMLSCTVGSSLLLNFPLRQYQPLFIYDHTAVFEKHQIWRVFSSRMVFSDLKDLFLCTILLYYFRLFERRFGSRKFVSYMMGTGLLATLLEMGVSYCCRYWDIPLGPLPAGPLCFVYPLFVPYYCDVPRVVMSQIWGIPMTGKSFSYILGLQVASTSPESIVVAVCGILSGILWRVNFVKIQSIIQVPNFVSKLFSATLGRLLDTNNPVEQDLKSFGATLELQRQENLERLEHQLLMQSLRNSQQGRNIHIGRPQPQNLANGHGIFGTGNNNNPDGLRQRHNSAAAEAPAEVSEDQVQMLTEMGFNDAQVRQALQMCNNDLNTATNFLLQHS